MGINPYYQRGLSTLVSGSWAIAGSVYPTTAVRGRYRPTITGVTIAAIIPWLILPSWGRGADDNRGVIVVILAFGVVSTMGQVVRDCILGEAPTKDPLKGGATRNRSSATLNCRPSCLAVFGAHPLFRTANKINNGHRITYSTWLPLL